MAATVTIAKDGKCDIGARVCKADPITYDEPVPDGLISIKDPLPCSATMDEARDLHIADAALIFAVLKNTLPQGTRYELIKLFLNDSANLYRGL